MESRIEDLEIRFAHQELALETLSEQVREQASAIQALQAQIQHLHSAMKGLVESNIAPASEETPPPHY